MDDVKQKNIRLLRIVTLADSSIFLWPVLILFYYKVAGNAAGAGVLLSARSIASAVGELPTGYFSDWFGRARTTQAASFFYTISAVMTLLSWWHGFWVLFTAVIIQGVAEACESGNHDSLLYESSDSKEQYQKISTKLSTLGSLFGAISAVVGGFLGAKSLMIVAAASVAPRFISFIGSLGLHDISKVHKNEVSVVSTLSQLRAVLVHDKQVRWVVLGKMISEGFGEVNWQFRALFVSTVWPLWAVGFSMPISLLAHTAGSMSYTRFQTWFNKFDPIKTVLLTTLLAKITLTISYGIQSVVSPFIIGVAGALSPINRAAYMGLMHSKLHSSVRASGLSATSFLQTVLFSVTSIVFGSLIDMYGVRRTLVIVALCSLTSTLFYWKATRVRGIAA